MHWITEYILVVHIQWIVIYVLESTIVTRWMFIVASCIGFETLPTIMDNTNAMVMGFMCPLGYGNSNINQTMADRSILTFLIALSDKDIFFMLQHLTKVPATVILLLGTVTLKTKRMKDILFCTRVQVCT